MDPSAQSGTSTTIPSTSTAPSQQPATPPISSPLPVSRPKERLRSWPFVILGIILAFFLGIGFDKYHIASYISKIRLPKLADKSIPKPTPTIQITPTPTASPTTTWKTFLSADMTFQYPPDWTLNGNLIATTSPKIKLVVIAKNSTLMNECMQQVGAMTQPDYIVKKFIRVTTGEACATGDVTPRELWIVPSINAFTPGISFSYSASEATQAGQLFTQILNTFKFLKGEATVTTTPVASASASLYKCPSSDYVDCMPVLTPEKQAACTPEAMAWYKINCPNFKGGAM